MAAGGLLATQAAAHADFVSTGNFGAVNGNQIYLPIQAPIDVCGNSIAAGLAGAYSACDGGSAAINGGTESDFVSAGNFGAASGNQVYLPIQAPIDVCGNAIAAVAAGAFATCDGGSVAVHGDGEDRRHSDDDKGYQKHHGGDEFAAMAEGKGKGKDKDRHKRDWDDAGYTWITSGNYGLLNGNQVYAPIQVPINICGNAIAILGAGAAASCDGGAVAVKESARADGYDHDGRDHDGKGRDHDGNGGTLFYSANNYGLANGNQVYAPIQAPIDICGNAIAILLAGASAHCDGGSVAVQESARSNGWDDNDVTMISYGNYGALNGNQVYLPIQAPIDICGNAIAAGLAGASASCDGGSVAIHESARAEGARDEALPVLGQLPVVAGLPLVGQLGQGAAPAAPKADTAPGARSTTGATEGDDYDDAGRHGKDHNRGKHGDDHRGAHNGGKTLISAGNYGLLNGNQVLSGLQLPLDISGNGIAALGAGAFAHSTGGAAAISN
ncbi:chaplin family protein [Asanoa sp. NPDC049573]|uniref:chaplin family protein n=1 Tax=Asanoa sp. NPDC049573 TaxID=3155396 RepID=UPI00342871B5